MGQEGKQSKPKSIAELIDHWNPVADSLEVIGMFLVTEGKYTLKSCGKLADAREIIADALQEAVDLQNKQWALEQDQKNQAEEALRKELAKKTGAKEEKDVKEVKSVKTTVEAPENEYADKKEK